MHIYYGVIKFEFKKIYPCTLTLSDTKVRYYKIYGEEFDDMIEDLYGIDIDDLFQD